ncbi:ADP-ribosylation factor-binding protein GGA2 isoform X1 [Frankliniella occidentalis]|uniref:ADP-ribosylation factor-binding protein GGA2 isoform X1 n=2 Tax=Frankliniella occidentalis TaxID=133901 RepID=A0A6J1RZW7_FRAOC|nr:ADP-ribosylation factor-binding protein GGA2 isoform X1 [Frankliniella occidentalis]
MDIVATSLEALIQRATSPTNPGPDTAAIDAFCGMVNKEPNSAHIATKLITTQIQSPQEWEALQSLNLLEACMKRCGSSFHTEIGKFRFLNEMIKLVSPKYLGSQTPKPVRDRVLQLMYSWTMDYPRETKIKEAYQMLRKQGVVTDDPPAEAVSQAASQTSAGSSKSSVFEDEKKQRLLQKLLQSKNPEDLQAANRLIKTMVKEDERRSEIMSRRATELEAAHNNARLLSEMLDCYRPSSSSKEDLDLIKELHQSCERFSLQISRDLKPEESLFGEVLETIDELKHVFSKYMQVVVQGQPIPKSTSSTTTAVKAPHIGVAGSSLLDLMTPSGDNSTAAVTEQLAELGMTQTRKDLDGVGDLLAFTTEDPSSSSFIPSNVPVLQPLPLNSPATSMSTHVTSPSDQKSSEEKPGALKALEDLDVLGETLLKQSLPSAVRTGSHFNKVPAKVPMNLLGRSSSGTSENGTSVSHENGSTASGGLTESSLTSTFDLDFLIGNQSQPTNIMVQKIQDKTSSTTGADDLLNGDDAMVDLSDDPSNLAAASLSAPIVHSAPQISLRSAKEEAPDTNDPIPKKETEFSTLKSTTNSVDALTNTKPVESAKTLEVKPLNDISVTLDSIKPGPVPPLTALDERNGISVVLHLAKDTPRPDVSVYVVSTISKNSSPLSNYVFQAVVPKSCKLKLLSSSSAELPAHNPFLPPSAITQVMLVANPSKVPVNLKFMVSYTMDDDTVTEMGEVESLPMLS